jgi:hypothetical protein
MKPMKNERSAGPTPPPPGVAGRLARLRDLCPLETEAEARARFASERPARSEPFARAVSRRLHDLRQLCALAEHLHKPR